MLCAFTSFLEFDKCVKNLEQILPTVEVEQEDVRSKVFVFHANVEGRNILVEGSNSDCARDSEASDDWDEIIQRFESSQYKCSPHAIYGFAIQKSKIEVSSQWKSIDELKESFPTVPEGFIQRLWQQQHQSWQSCFQILSSLLLSKERIWLDDCEFIFEHSSWPDIVTSKHGIDVRTARGEDIDQDWTMIDLNSYLSLPTPPFTSSTALTDWQHVRKSLPILSHERSYRDVLLTASPAGAIHSVVSEKQVPRSSDTWKPTIRIESVPSIRKDRTYVNTKLNFNEMFGLPADLHLTEEEKAYLMQLQQEDEG